eukprot:TRINITY_DN8229_c0_g2_i1.p1 TRINITY_DN8229_c0_g2~~TRINITY_DN8229_c0_g2_i1.p1  ORF type:complete len:661 (+),score=148.30 TRINITY_DN8229_c0_g2_i1:61-1983(+)
MSFLRSEEMSLYKLIFEYNNRWNTMECVGQLSALQFVPVNQNHSSRAEQALISRFNECEKMVHLLSQTAREFSIEQPPPLDYFELTAELENYSQEFYQSANVDSNSLFEHIEGEQLKRTADAIQRNCANLAELTDNSIALSLYCKALKVADEMFVNVNMKDWTGIDIKAGRIMAVVRREFTFPLQRLLFRTMKGNVLISVECLPDPIIKSGDRKEYKDVMLIMFKEGVNINERISKACSAYADLYFEVPADIKPALEEKQMRLKDVNLTKDSTEKFIVNTLTNLVNGTKSNIRLQTIKYFVEKFKKLNLTLNQMVLCGSVYEGLCWCSVKDEQKVINKLKESSKTNRFVKVPIKPEYPPPPTAIRQNQFLDPFQSIVSTYGIPSYQEINPAYFTIITFPFLFGVMFGDVLHGSIILFVAVYLIWANKDTMAVTNSLLVYLWPYRYMLLLLGFFSVYCGFVYNEAGSLPLTMFETCFKKDSGFTCTYPFGFDSIWKTGSNELTFVNSYKMKLSVIIACLHLVLGVILKGIDCLYRRRPSDFFFEFVPELLFTLSIVGYLAFLIVYKWLTRWSQSPPPPSVLATVIDTFLKPFEKPEDSILPSNTQYLVNTVLLCKAKGYCRHRHCLGCVAPSRQAYLCCVL